MWSCGGFSPTAKIGLVTVLSGISLLSLRITFWQTVVCVSGVKQKWSVCNLKDSGRYGVSLHWTQNKASSHVYSGFRVAVWPNEPNETFTQWKIETAPSQLACIKIPHRPSSFSQTYFFLLLFLLLIELIFPQPFWRGITEDFLEGWLFWPVLFLCDLRLPRLA